MPMCTQRRCFTHDELELAKSGKGGYCFKQVEYLGINPKHKGWFKKICNSLWTEEQIMQFIDLRDKSKDKFKFGHEETNLFTPIVQGKPLGISTQLKPIENADTFRECLKLVRQLTNSEKKEIVAIIFEELSR